MIYRDEIIAWLSKYKKTHFNGLGDGVWKRNQKHYPHILPEDCKYHNLLPTYRDSFCRSDYCEIMKLHPDFHHLNYSQAMCVNFLYPFIKEEKLDVIIQALNFSDDHIKPDTICFEKESPIELEFNSRPTSFDFYFQTKERKEFHFEIKYTERDFGKVKHDEGHAAKYKKVYKSRCLMIQPQYRNENSFLDHYQLMRNLIHVSTNSLVVFIYPIGNRKINEQAEFARSDLVLPEFQKNIITMTWERLLGLIEDKIGDSNNMTRQMNDFKEKYKIIPSF